MFELVMSDRGNRVGIVLLLVFFSSFRVEIAFAPGLYLDSEKWMQEQFSEVLHSTPQNVCGVQEDYVRNDIILSGARHFIQLLGLGILAVGIWAWTEKDTFNNLSRLTKVALDPAFMLILIGTVTFIIGFAGCVGALRENTCLLAAYAIFLAILLLLEMTVGVLGFVFKDSIKAQATHGFQVFIKHYREDPDQQNLIDWIQEDWLQCCGIEGPKDWDRNNYFNCSSREVGSREACGVPFSCCKRKPNEIIKNKQCGYDVRKPGYYADGWTNLSPTQPGERNIFERGCLRAGEEWVETNLVPVAGVAVGVAVLQKYDVGKIINEKGCVQAGEEWMEHNLLIIAVIAVTTAFLQILGICFAQNLRADIFAQKAKWH